MAINRRKFLSSLMKPQSYNDDVGISMVSGTNPTDEEKLTGLRSKGVKIRPIDATTNWLQAKVPSGYSVDSLIKKDLFEIRFQITLLELGGTCISDKVLAFVGEFQYLTRLYLQNTMVTDLGLQNLKKLNFLEYLNLVNTQITDEGIENLLGLKNLRKLYLWQTGVSEKGIQKLKESIPKLEIHTGMKITMKNRTSLS